MATQFTLPRQVKINVAGRPYAGAQAFFYQTGTETLQTVYQDSALQTPHQQPILADDDGYWPVIWLDQNADFDYRAVVKSATGAQLEDVGNIPRKPFSSSDIATTLDSLQRTQAEISAEVLPSNYAYPPYSVGPRYRFSPSGNSSENVISFQSAVDAMNAAISLKTYTPDGYGANTYTGPVLEIADGVYSIDNAITLPPYTVIRGKNVVLVQTDATKDHFTTTAPYRIDIEGVTFKGGRRALTASGGTSANTARVRMAHCQFHTANASNYAVLIDNGTMNATFEQCLVLDSPLWLDIYGDYCLIDNCWVNGYLRSTGLKPNNTASVNNRARVMHVRGGSWVPQVDGMGSSTSTRWFNNGNGVSAILVLEDVQFGAENAGLPIVYEYGNSAETSAQSHPFVSLSGVIIRGGQLADGASGRSDRGVVVLQGAVPSLIDIRGGTFTVDGKFVSDAGFSSPTLAEWLTTNAINANYPRIAVNLEDCGEHGSTFVPDPLLPFTRIKRKSRGLHPGYNNLGPINEPLTLYLPDWTGKQARILSNVSGQKRDPASTTYFTALTVSKEANESNGTGACVIEILATCHGEVSGPVGFVSSAMFMVSLIANRSGNIQSVVTTVTSNNQDGSGGATVGNVIQCQVTGTSATTVNIQLRINTTITASSATVTWQARMLSNTSTVGSPGRAFSIASA